jgi:hypothetical protein
MNVKQPKIALTHENFSQQSPAFRQSVGANASSFGQVSPIKLGT